MNKYKSLLGHFCEGEGNYEGSVLLMDK